MQTEPLGMNGENETRMLLPFMPMDTNKMPKLPDNHAIFTPGMLGRMNSIKPSLTLSQKRQLEPNYADSVNDLIRKVPITSSSSRIWLTKRVIMTRLYWTSSRLHSTLGLSIAALKCGRSQRLCKHITNLPRTSTLLLSKQIDSYLSEISPNLARKVIKCLAIIEARRVIREVVQTRQILPRPQVVPLTTAQPLARPTVRTRLLHGLSKKKLVLLVVTLASIVARRATGRRTVCTRRSPPPPSSSNRSKEEAKDGNPFATAQ